MKKLLTAMAVVVLVSGCRASGSYGQTIHKEEMETDYSSVYAEIIEFDGINNKEYESELNMSIADNVSDAIKNFDALAMEAQATLPTGIKSALYITQEVKRNSGDIISFITEHYIYTGGAHGNTSWYPRTVDVSTQSPHDLSLDELFSDEEYMEKLNKIIDEMVKDNPNKYSELWAETHIREETKNRFYLTDTDLVIFFPPYELSYYAKGFIEFPIPLEELNPILNDRYRGGC